MKSITRPSRGNGEEAAWALLRDHTRIELDGLTPASGVSNEEWSSFEKDDRVTVKRAWDPLFSGSVDVVAPDGSVFWVWGDEGRGRFAVHSGDDVRVWRSE